MQTLSPRQRGDLQRRLIGFVFQSYHLIEDLTVAEDLEVPLKYRDVPKRERQSLVRRRARSLPHRRQEGLYPSQLSGGEQQLVGIAGAVIAGSQVILADEPTLNLHSDQAREIMELFREPQSGRNDDRQVTHSEDNARYGNRVIRLCDGWLVT